MIKIVRNATSTDKRIWEPPVEDDTIKNMERRIMSAIFQPCWKRSIEICVLKEKPIERLKVVEVGCGTGTMALSFGLLGAQVTCIDFNDNVLKRARKIYELYGCSARFINADCLENIPDDLRGAFDMVISVGLAEHFTGEARSSCLAYHNRLLKEGGFVFIVVPNRFSPFYRFIRSFRMLTGTWAIDIEVPFSSDELKNLASEMGLKDVSIIGNSSFKEDVISYWYGFLSAILDIFPSSFRKFVRKHKERKKEASLPVSIIREKVKKHYNDIFNGVAIENKTTIFDRYSSGLVLFAFK